MTGNKEKLSNPGTVSRSQAQVNGAYEDILIHKRESEALLRWPLCSGVVPRTNFNYHAVAQPGMRLCDSYRFLKIDRFDKVQDNYTTFIARCDFIITKLKTLIVQHARFKLAAILELLQSPQLPRTLAGSEVLELPPCAWSRVTRPRACDDSAIVADSYSMAGLVSTSLELPI